MRRSLANIYRLGVKELWSLWRDPVMLVLIVFSFTVSVYTAATSVPETLNNAPIAIVDEDQSPLSQRIVAAFYPPMFSTPALIDLASVDPGMDAGIYTFALVIPPNFQRDVLAGRAPQIQLNTDATRMTQAFSGSGYIQQLVLAEVQEFVQRHRGAGGSTVDLALRARFNPTLDKTWFGGLSQIINQITMLSIVL
ncbi:MAG TPA: ABC transporter permease, partial [Rubrivivax sp.]|nr:ABC transporter permease [Rubrivivax sp.]